MEKRIINFDADTYGSGVSSGSPSSHPVQTAEDTARELYINFNNALNRDKDYSEVIKMIADVLTEHASTQFQEGRRQMQKECIEAMKQRMPGASVQEEFGLMSAVKIIEKLKKL